MRELNVEEIQGVDGGLLPAMYAGFLIYNALSATQIAFGVGAVVGFGATFAAALD